MAQSPRRHGELLARTAAPLFFFSEPLVAASSQDGLNPIRRAAWRLAVPSDVPCATARAVGGRESNSVATRSAMRTGWWMRTSRRQASPHSDQ